MHHKSLVFVSTMLLGIGGVLPVAAQLPTDPTKPADFTPAKKVKVVVHRKYAVSYIKVAGEHSVAAVNGSLVSVGDRVDGARVLSIEPEKVVLRTSTGVRTFSVGARKKITKNVSKNQD